MSVETDSGFLSIGGTAAGAGIAVALTGLVLPAVGVFVPVIGGLLALSAMKLSGVLDDPKHPITTDSVDAP
jgi:hypothetical protein